MPPKPIGCFTYILFAAASAFIIAMVAFVYLIGWFADQLVMIQGLTLPFWVWPIITWALAGALAIILGPLALFTEAPRFRAAYQTWGLALLFTVVLAVVSFVPSLQEQFAAVMQIFLTSVATAVLLWVARWRKRALAWPPIQPAS